MQIVKLRIYTKQNISDYLLLCPSCHYATYIVVHLTIFHGAHNSDMWSSDDTTHYSW